MKKLPLLFLILFLVVACKKSEAAADNAIDMKISDKGSYYASVDTTAVADESVEMNAPSKEDENESSSGEQITPKIIKNGNLRFETDDLGKTYNQILSLTKKYKATIQNDSEGKNYNSVYKDLTIRVPNQNFDAFIQDISAGVPYFDTKEISSEDVTEEYIDVASRIKTKKALEARYLELLKKATKVSVAQNNR